MKKIELGFRVQAAVSRASRGPGSAPSSWPTHERNVGANAEKACASSRFLLLQIHFKASAEDVFSFLQLCYRSRSNQTGALRKSRRSGAKRLSSTSGLLNPDLSASSGLTSDTHLKCRSWTLKSCTRTRKIQSSFSCVNIWKFMKKIPILTVFITVNGNQ